MLLNRTESRCRGCYVRSWPPRHHSKVRRAGSIPRYSESRSFRCECYGCAVLREFGSCPGHIGKEQPANILQTLLDKLFDLLESSVEQSSNLSRAICPSPSH